MMAKNTRPRVLYFGMHGQLSRAPLAALLQAGFAICAVVVPPNAQATGRRNLAWRKLEPSPDWSAQPVSIADQLQRTATDVAWERGIPVLEVRHLRDVTLEQMLAPLAPDLIAVSCFPATIPARLLALPRRGALNLHPSPLPHGRGPAPLFWAFRERGKDDATPWGVSIHLMDQGLDSGPIIAQELFALPDGMTQKELDLLVATRGADLLVRAVQGLMTGVAMPRVQDEALATYHPWPGVDDFVVRPDRSARWAFNFIRGTAGWGHPHRLIVGDRQWVVRAAQGYDMAATLPAPFVQAGATIHVQCNPGVLTITVASDAGRA